MKKVSEVWKTLCERWKNRMPKFFRVVFGIGMTMSGTAVAVQEALRHYDITPDDWWLAAYKYLIGIGVGLATASKLTQEYHGKKDENHNTVLDKDDN